MFKRRHIYLLAIIPIALYFPVQGLAAGKITIKPKVSTSWQLDSNFYKAETIERDVYTYLVQPGIELGYETPKSQVLLNYTLNSYYYDDKGTVPSGQEPADKEDYTGHTGILRARARPFDRLALGLDNSYYKTRDPGQSDRFSNAIDRDKYFINRLTPLVFYEFGPKFTAGIRYRNTETDYDIGTMEDSTENRGMFDLVYNPTRLTSLDLEYQRWKRDYDLTTSDYTSDQIKLILRKQFKYFSFEMGGGSHNRDFDDPSLKDIDVFTYRIALIGQNPPAPEPWRSHITYDAEQNFNVSGTGDTYFKATRFSLDAGHLFEEKILVGINCCYQISDYETFLGLTPAGTTELREDKTFDISGSLGYLFTDWLTFSITAGYEERDSNLAGYDYDNRYYMLKIDLVYNLGTR
jgi:hypothetical protein